MENGGLDNGGAPTVETNLRYVLRLIWVPFASQRCPDGTIFGLFMFFYTVTASCVLYILL